MAQSEQDTRTAPFGPWVTFKNFLGQDLKGKVIPPQIDHTMFRGKSGTDSRHLRATLRFFGLVAGEKDEVTPELRDVVAAHGTDSWSMAVRGLLERHYAGIVEGVDLRADTQGRLEEAFKQRGNVSGSTLRKAVRFYLAAAREAGVQVSPHFASVRASSGAENGEEKSAPRPSTQKPRRNRRMSPSDENQVLPPPPGVDVIQPLPGKDFRIWIPKDLTQAEIDFGMKYLKDYLKLVRGGGGAK